MARALVVAWTAALVLVASGQGHQGSTGAVTQASQDTLPWTEGPSLSPGDLAAYREEAKDSEDPVDWYNLGAALLLIGDWEGSLSPLVRALDEEDDEEELDESATYDLGVAHAVAGRPRELQAEAEAATDLEPEERREHLLRARDEFRWVLRTDPTAEDARWNLELVNRWLEEEEPPPGDGGSGSGQSDQDSGGGGSGEGTPELSSAQAQDILDAAALEEMRVQGKRLERNRTRDPIVERNW